MNRYELHIRLYLIFKYNTFSRGTFLFLWLTSIMDISIRLLYARERA